ncbi:MAG TPA: acyl-CoA dehydrogenase C-terminal domain-containing protein, partial [Sphingomicrobium sp.]
AYNEAGRALVLWGALQVDLVRRSQDEAERQTADDLLGLITPVIKGYLTDKGFKAAVEAQQVFGGHGYIREHGMEQFVRDARITQIYEGTNGIQAMDLVGRKLPKDGGRAVRAFFELVGRDIAEAKSAGDPAGVAAALEPALGDLQAATMWLAQNGMANPDNAGAGAYPYMDLMGLVSLGWMWLKMAAASQSALNDGADDKPFHEAKLVTARFYAQRELPLSNALRRKIEAGAETLMQLPEEVF